MLDKYDNEALSKIQHAVTVDDPDFVENFRVATRAFPSKRHDRWRIPAIVVLLLLMVLMIVVALPARAFLFGTLAGVLAAWPYRDTIRAWWNEVTTEQASDE